MGIEFGELKTKLSFGSRGSSFGHGNCRTKWYPIRNLYFLKIWNPDCMCLFVTEEIQYHGGLRSRELGQGPILLCVPNSYLGRRYHLTRVKRWSDCIGYRIEIVWQIGTLSTILQHSTHNETVTHCCSPMALCAAGCIP